MLYTKQYIYIYIYMHIYIYICIYIYIYIYIYHNIFSFSILPMKFAQWGFVHYAHLLLGFCPGGFFAVGVFPSGVMSWIHVHIGQKHLNNYCPYIRTCR